MCTVTFVPRRTGYRLAMNRDEQLDRVEALPPARRKLDGRAVIYPSEPGGGTWIALNDQGVCLTLVNWYSIATRVAGKFVSRGRVIPAVCAFSEPDLTHAALEGLPLMQINPFRLVGIFPNRREIAEWRWDLKRLVRQPHAWRAQQWISSGFDEPAAQRVRGRIFRLASRQVSTGRVDWLRRLHRSHAPKVGPTSTCMHREDAATVSYTEVAVLPRQAGMAYHAGAPCRGALSAVYRWMSG